MFQYLICTCWLPTGVAVVLCQSFEISGNVCVHSIHPWEQVPFLPWATIPASATRVMFWLNKLPLTWTVSNLSKASPWTPNILVFSAHAEGFANYTLMKTPIFFILFPLHFSLVWVQKQRLCWCCNSISHILRWSVLHKKDLYSGFAKALLLLPASGIFSSWWLVNPYLYLQ